MWFLGQSPRTGKSRGWRSLVGCSPRGRQESDTTEWLHFHALEKEMTTHSGVLAWRIPGTGDPGGLLSMESHRVGHNWSDLAAAAPRFSSSLFFNWKEGRMWTRIFLKFMPAQISTCLWLIIFNPTATGILVVTTWNTSKRTLFYVYDIFLRMKHKDSMQIKQEKEYL